MALPTLQEPFCPAWVLDHMPELKWTLINRYCTEEVIAKGLSMVLYMKHKLIHSSAGKGISKAFIHNRDDMEQFRRN